MKKSYIIDDNLRLTNIILKEGLKPVDFSEILETSKEFNVVYTLEGEPCSGTFNYELVDNVTKKKININTLNGYEHSLLNVCFSSFNSNDDEIAKGEFIEVK